MYGATTTSSIDFNSLGYRCPEFDRPAGIRILAVGCSYVFGLGVAQGDLFHERFARRLREGRAADVTLWNLGTAGASNDTIARLLLLAVPRLDPHVVLIHFTHTSRREYVSVENRVFYFNPSFRPGDRVGRDIFGRFTALLSPHDDRANFFRNYKLAELLLRDRRWLYSLARPDVAGSLVEHMDLSRYAGPLRELDLSRDRWHPGPESHEVLADLYWKKFVELGGSASCRSAIADRLHRGPSRKIPAPAVDGEAGVAVTARRPVALGLAEVVDHRPPAAAAGLRIVHHQLLTDPVSLVALALVDREAFEFRRGQVRPQQDDPAPLVAGDVLHLEQVEHRLEPRLADGRDRLDLRRRRRLRAVGEPLERVVDVHQVGAVGIAARLEELQEGLVGRVEQERTPRRLAVAAGAAGLLVIGFQVRGEVVMDHEPDVGLVDPEAEGVGGDHHPSGRPLMNRSWVLPSALL